MIHPQVDRLDADTSQFIGFADESRAVLFSENLRAPRPGRVDYPPAQYGLLHQPARNAHGRIVVRGLARPRW